MGRSRDRCRIAQAAQTLVPPKVLETVGRQHAMQQAQRIRVALAGGMSVRKTAAKFDVNPSTVHRIARPFDDVENASAATAG
jgi:hypothetical protein